MREGAFRFFLPLCCVCSLIFSGCNGTNSTAKSDFSELKSLFCEGDLLFRRGTGVVGHIVASVDRKGEYSHVGIVVRRDNGWFVVHAVPHEPDFEGDFDRVKCEPADDFLTRYPKADIGLYRPEVEQEKIATAIKGALRQYEKQVPFDHDYDLEDTTRLYCTELVEYVYGLAGVSISEGRRTEVTFPTMAGRHLMPSDLTESDILTPIY